MNVKFSTETLDGLLRQLLDGAGLRLAYRIEANAEGSRPLLAVEFNGDDAAMLTARNGELLLALEHIAAKALRLEAEEHDLIRFEADGFKAHRERNLLRAAAAAVEEVRRTDKAYQFPPMSSHERRLLHLALTDSGLRTASDGEGPTRHLVLHPSRARNR